MKMDLPLWIFDSKIGCVLEKICLSNNILEVRLRLNKPICILTDKGKYFMSSDGSLSVFPISTSIICQKSTIQNVVMNACDNSVYAKQNQINHGFITIRGGHRIGLCGRAVYTNGIISNITDIYGLNVRFARNVKGMANKLRQKYIENGIANTLIVGSVGSGKTTVLRDIIRTLASADDFGLNVSIIDEREEIGGEFNLGEFSDLLTGYKKPDGIENALRTLSPDVIAFDEFSSKAELESIINCFNCGVKVITTCHAKNHDELMRKPYINELIQSGRFRYFVYLKDKQIERIVENESNYTNWNIFDSNTNRNNFIVKCAKKTKTT